MCDGLIVHPFSTARYVREVLRPAAGDASFSLSALVASAGLSCPLGPLVAARGALAVHVLALATEQLA